MFFSQVGSIGLNYRLIIPRSPRKERRLSPGSHRSEDTYNVLLSSLLRFASASFPSLFPQPVFLQRYLFQFIVHLNVAEMLQFLALYTSTQPVLLCMKLTQSF